MGAYDLKPAVTALNAAARCALALARQLTPSGCTCRPAAMSRRFPGSRAGVSLSSGGGPWWILGNSTQRLRDDWEELRSGGSGVKYLGLPALVAVA